jgi:hypothetical protein
VTQTLQLLSLVLLLSATAFTQSPSLHCQVTDISARARSLRVACQLAGGPAGRLRVQFRDEFAGMRGLSERVSGLRISGADGAAVLPEMPGEGAFAFAFTGAATIRYEMRLAHAYDPGQHALVSSLGPEAAVLMAADLLPRVCPGESNCEGPARLRIAPPAGWTVATGETRDGEDFAIADPSRAVFVLGALRERQAKLGDMILRTAVAGSWSLGDDDIATLIEAIAREQSAMVGGREAGAFLVTLAPYPQPMTGLRSSAVTIGRTVVLLLLRFAGGIRRQ